MQHQRRLGGRASVADRLLCRGHATVHVFRDMNPRILSQLRSMNLNESVNKNESVDQIDGEPSLLNQVSRISAIQPFPLLL